MKVPVPSPKNSNSNDTNNSTNQSPNPKPISISSNNIGDTNNNNCYEPTSVLDLRRSPSPVTAVKTASAKDPVEWDDRVLQSLDWDSIMTEIDFSDESAPSLLRNFSQFVPNCVSQIQNQSVSDFTPPHIDPTHQFLSSEFTDAYLNTIPTHNLPSLDLSHGFHNNIGNNWNYVGFDVIQELIQAVDYFDSNEPQLAQVVLERLNPRLKAPMGKPLQRAAFFFKEALHSLLIRGSTRPRISSSWPEIIQTIKAYEAFFSLSPIPMFTDFTTIQALLDTIDGSPPFIHVIDFDIGLGCQYASFMRELVEKGDPCQLTTPFLRVTAVVQEEYGAEAAKMIKERLSQFAHELKIRFHIDFVLMRTFEMLSFKAIKFVDGEQIAVLLSPTIFRRLGSANNVRKFVGDVQRSSPNVVVCVDNEGWSEPGVGSSFRKNFVSCLEFYSMLFESLDAAVAGAGGDWARKIEMFILKPRIQEAVESCGRRVAPPWREAFYGAGMRAVQHSQLAEFQAQSLLRKMQVRGFSVAKRQAELVLCWHEAPIIATSAWRW